MLKKIIYYKHIIIYAIFIFFIFLNSYRIEYLPKGYKKNHWNDYVFDISKKNNNEYDIVFHGVMDYYTVDEYILVLTMKILIEEETILYSDKREYWIYNYITNDKIGPMREKEFYNFIRSKRLFPKFPDLSSQIHLFVQPKYWNVCCQYVEKENNKDKVIDVFDNLDRQ